MTTTGADPFTQQKGEIRRPTIMAPTCQQGGGYVKQSASGRSYTAQRRVLRDMIEPLLGLVVWHTSTASLNIVHFILLFYSLIN